MQPIKIWQVTGEGPKKLGSSRINLEKELEKWIENDPSLLEEGLTIIGRQITLPDSGRLDLLGIDVQGSIVVVEIKKGAVDRDTIAQAIDYASAIVGMPLGTLLQKVETYTRERSKKAIAQRLMENRENNEHSLITADDLRIFVVGTGKQIGLERMVKFLSSYTIPISVVSYEVFDVGKDQRILIREWTESEVKPVVVEKPRAKLNSVFSLAEQYDVLTGLQRLYDGAMKHKLYPRLWPTSIMFTPPQNHARMLFTVWARPKQAGRIRIYNGPSAFAEFYPVTEHDIERLLGPVGWRDLSEAEVSKFVAGLDALFALIAQETGTSNTK